MMSSTTTHLRQVVVYVEDDIYQRILAIKGTDRRLSLSYIGERLFREALPAVEKQLIKRRVYFWSLYLLGSRPGEVRMIQPAHIFLNREIPCWIKPTSKNGRPHVVPLPEQLAPLWHLLLMANPRESHWLFWGDKPDRVWGRTSCQKMWESLRAKAGLPHLWLNDLRRSTASDLLNQGENLGVVQSQLNHRSLSQTAKYAWLAVRPLSEALQKRADRIVHATEGGAS